MSSLLIQIVSGHESPEKRVFKNRDTGVDRITFEQRAYMHNGGAFPQQIKISHDDINEVLPVGDYNICLSSYQANKYGKLELSPFNTMLVPVKK
jgi:hypothetical protein